MRTTYLITNGKESVEVEVIYAYEPAYEETRDYPKGYESLEVETVFYKGVDITELLLATAYDFSEMEEDILNSQKQ